MAFDEKIHTHLMSVWRESKSFFGVGGKEGMLLLTDNHLIFLKRTERMKKWWGAASKRQIVTLLQNKFQLRHYHRPPHFILSSFVLFKINCCQLFVPTS